MFVRQRTALPAVLLALPCHGEGCTDAEGQDGKLQRLLPMQEEGMHAKPCMEVAKPTPSVQPARDATHDKEHKRGMEMA
ncbi:MAG: hypothetical protein NDP22_00995 [Crenarchaeota archaeon]|nr:hypothetical protein [Thermoproteota archaeon]